LAARPATIKAYFYGPTGEKAQAVKPRYLGVCRGCGAYTQPRKGKGDPCRYCKRCHSGAIQRKWTRERVVAATFRCFRLDRPDPARPFVRLLCVAKLPSLRASDSDREHVAERLRCATAEGRLTADELEERLGVLFASRTSGELDALEADLRTSRSRVPVARWAGAVSGTLVLALLGRLAARRGHSDAAAVASGGHPRQVRFPGLLVDPGPGLTVAASMVRLTLLERDGEVRVNVETAGYRSSFVGAVRSS
jgi:hypothetical protein